MPEDWRQLLRSSVSPLHKGARQLDVLPLRPVDLQQSRPTRNAAVLLGVLDQDRPEILLTVRSRHLAQHAGQISFPGGAAEAGGETGVLTALREAEEEIGLRPASVQPLGFLDRVDTISDYRVLPVVGLVRQSGPWTPDCREVEEVFTLPLEVTLDLDSYSQKEIERQGGRHVVYSLNWQERTVWGVTATILRNLAVRARRA